MIKKWNAAIDDYGAALENIRVAVRPNEKNQLETMYINEVLCLDGIGIASSQLGQYGHAIDSYNRALGVAGQGSITDSDVPSGAPVSGLRGGAPTLRQRIELHRSFAQAGNGDMDLALSSLEAIDKGPDVPVGYPQFWEVGD